MPPPEMKRIKGLEIEQDIRHQRREWRLERIGWSLIGLLLVGALAGLLGSGPLSRATAGPPGSTLRVEYQRFDRYQAPARIKVLLSPEAAPAGTVRLRISRRYIETMENARVTPPPERVEAGPEWFVYVFRVPNPGQTAITYGFEPNRFGRMEARFSLEGGPQVAFSQFIYP